MTGRTLRIATRSSPLALWQAERVSALLAAAGAATELVPMESLGDRILDKPLHEIGGQGVFVKEVQSAVLAGAADLAVHSAKDLPSGPPPEGLVLAAVPERADARDALVLDSSLPGAGLDALPQGATVATGSVRRRAQLAHLRPDLVFVDLRGNMATRLSKVPAGGAVVAAAAALERLELAHLGVPLGLDVLVPQVAQGALAVECRADDADVVALLAATEDRDARVTVDAERAFLAELGSGCDLPVGAHASSIAGQVVVDGLVASLDGSFLFRHRHAEVDGVAAGRRLANMLLDGGGRALLAGRP